ncbi:MAG TPA: TIGR02281 family clan AA aspartic protease [Rhizomicrobium sp.]
MSDGGSPWHGKPAANGSSRTRLLVWIALVLGAISALVALAKLFPGALSDDFSMAYLLRGVVVLALVSAGIVYGRKFHLREAVRNGLIWVGIFLVLAIGFAYQDEIKAVALRLRSELIPGYAVQSNAQELVLTESEGGNFYVYGAVNGQPVKFLIDTGASEIVLSPSDAVRLGIDTNALDYNRSYQTANGVGLGAPYQVNSLQIGTIALSDVSVSINKADMSESLLGMTFLKRMASVEIRGRRLFLHWRR